MNKVAIITGITGQDGSYLTELLDSKDTLYMELLEEIQILIQKE